MNLHIAIPCQSCCERGTILGQCKHAMAESMHGHYLLSSDECQMLAHAATVTSRVARKEGGLGWDVESHQIKITHRWACRQCIEETFQLAGQVLNRCEAREC